MTRLQANKKLLKILKELVINNPDQRFSQVLQNLGFVKPSRPVRDLGMIEWQNEFYLESEELLKRVKGRIEGLE